MEDKLINILGRYIQYNYPELLDGKLYFDTGGVSRLYSMSYENCYIGSVIIHGVGNIASVNFVDRFQSLRYVFGDEYKELLRKWFNREHENMLYSLLGNDCGIVFINI